MGWKDRRSGGDPLEVAAVLEPGVLQHLQDVVRTGALVSLGLSRDGGSMSCTVTFDGEWTRQWFRDAVELGGWLEGVAADLLEETGGVLPSPPPPTASRDRRRPQRGAGGPGSK